MFLNNYFKLFNNISLIQIGFSKNCGYCERSVAICWESWCASMQAYPTLQSRHLLSGLACLAWSALPLPEQLRTRLP